MERKSKIIKELKKNGFSGYAIKNMTGFANGYIYRVLKSDKIICTCCGSLVDKKEIKQHET